MKQEIIDFERFAIQITSSPPLFLSLEKEKSFPRNRKLLIKPHSRQRLLSLFAGNQTEQAGYLHES